MTKKPTILFLFNSSSYAYEPWLRDGRFNIVSVDYHDTDHSAAHNYLKHKRRGRLWQLNYDLSQPDAKEAILLQLRLLGLQGPALVVSMPPCTDLAVSGAKHFAEKLKRDPQCQERAVKMAKLASTFGCAWMAENPVSVLSSKWRKPNVYFHPYEYSAYIPEDEGPHPEFPGLIADFDLYPKKTGIWHGQGFVFPPASSLGVPEKQYSEQFYKLGGKSAQTKYIRSLSPRGFFFAVYVYNCEKIAKPQLDLFRDMWTGEVCYA